MNFESRLRELRMSRHLSQRELAKRLGFAPSCVSMYEAGKREPSFEIEEAIADFFNVDLNYLRGGQDTTTKLITGDAHLLLHIFNQLEPTDQAQLLGYAKAMFDIKVDKMNREGLESNND